jgi:hypothetical protein
MADVDEDFERRQLLKAYRRGLITDELFEEQMREIAGNGGSNGRSPARVAEAHRYHIGKRSYATERAMLLRFLDDFRAAETFGSVVLSSWLDVARDRELRGGLRVVCEREAMHGRLLGARLAEIGGRAEKSLPEASREAARARFGARDVSDADKIREIVRRLTDVDSAVAPIREVMDQIEEDRETRNLLQSILEDEAATVRWFHATAERLGVPMSRTSPT